MERAHHSRWSLAGHQSGGDTTSAVSKEELIALQQRHRTDAGIARVLGVSPSTVYRWRREAGVSALSHSPNVSVKRFRELQRLHRIDRAVAEALGQSPSAIRSWRKRHNIPPLERPRHCAELTKAQVLKLQREYGTDKAIARVLKTAPGTILNVRRRLGIGPLPPASRRRYFGGNRSNGVSGRRLTRGELVKLQRRYVTDEVIGETLGVTRQRVHQLRVKWGIPAIKHSALKPPVTAGQLKRLQRQHGSDSEIGKVLGAPPDIVKDWRARLGVAAVSCRSSLGKVLGKNKRAALLRLQREHGADYAIAEALGCVSNTITRWRHILDIPPSRPARGRNCREYGRGSGHKPEKRA